MEAVPGFRLGGSTRFSPTRPSGPSWSSSRDVCLFLSLFLYFFVCCPLFLGFSLFLILIFFGSIFFWCGGGQKNCCRRFNFFSFFLFFWGRKMFFLQGVKKILLFFCCCCNVFFFYNLEEAPKFFWGDVTIFFAVIFFGRGSNIFLGS